ncbi:hypothetical protein GIB67_000555 [Kingdonia uniflora]|uniref:Uncharacterized protein n=1 Tax=Kingdonia uniflora TaxID=39325 RepID=A0A7J7MIJ3_9MAGN|nr:hypothetical protein GIB67_000555 [Kingdonia uniflora]
MILRLGLIPPISPISTFSGFSLKFTRQSLNLTISIALKPLTVSATMKKVVAALKGTLKVEGIVTLSQDRSQCTSSEILKKGVFQQVGFTLGPHLNPNGLTHGVPEDEVRHAAVAKATIVDT